MPPDSLDTTADIKVRAPTHKERRRRGDVKAPAFAAIDLGTHNCRLLIAVPGSGGPRVIDGFSRIVRLGEGLGSGSCLCEEAISRTVSALRVCAGKLKRHKVLSYRAVATEACRRADNRASFFERVQNVTGLKLEVISAEEEARLTLAGCVPLLQGGAKRGLLFDIGGGSTELTWVSLEENGVPKVIGMTSLPIGVVTMAEEYGQPDCTEAAFNSLAAKVDRLLEPFDAQYGVTERVTAGDALLLGTSGTVTTLGALHLDLPKYDRSLVDGMVLERGRVVDLMHRVSKLNCEERSKMPCIGPERADLMVMGCAILAAVMRRWRMPEIRIADRGVREGLLLAMIGEHDRTKRAQSRR